MIIAQTAAGNEGAGNFMGIGVGNNLGEVVGNSIKQSGLTSPLTGSVPQLPSYYVAKGGQTTGPYSIDIIQNMIQQKEITATTYVYRIGGQAWILASEDADIYEDSISDDATSPTTSIINRKQKH